jgi:hypothetical protein
VGEDKERKEVETKSMLHITNYLNFRRNTVNVPTLHISNSAGMF